MVITSTIAGKYGSQVQNRVYIYLFFIRIPERSGRYRPWEYATERLGGSVDVAKVSYPGDTRNGSKGYESLSIHTLYLSS